MSTLAYQRGDPRADFRTGSLLLADPAATSTQGLAFRSVSGAVTIDALAANTEISLGAATNTDWRFNGGTAGQDALWDSSANTLFVQDSAILAIGTGSDLTITSGGVNVAIAAPNGTLDIQGSGAITVDSSAGAISVGSDVVAQPLNLGTGGARVITVGSAAAASMALDAGVGGFTLLADTTIDLDAAGAVSLNSTGGALNVGNDANAFGVNIGTGAAARVITIGNAASASMALDAGVGGFTLLADTTIDLDAAGAVSLNSTGAALNIGNDANAFGVNIGTGAAARTITIGNTTGATTVDLQGGATGTIDAQLGDATAATSFRVINSTPTTQFTVDGAGTVNVPLAGTIQHSAGFLVPCYSTAAPQVLAGAGAVTLTESYTRVESGGAIAITLAAPGAAVPPGFIKNILFAVDGGDATLTVTGLPAASDVWTFSELGQSLTLMAVNATTWQRVKETAGDTTVDSMAAFA